MDFSGLRALMVSTQLVPRGIKDDRVLLAMGKVPRHLFVPDSMQYRAYDDSALQIGEGQTVSQPFMVAMMTQLLELTGSERVLEIGTGSGYQTAILAELAREVYSVERFGSLSERAGERLRGLGYDNVHLMIGDGTLGWPEEAPFDRVLVTAGAPKIPEPFKGQLSEGGIIVAPVGDLSSQQLVQSRKSGGRFVDHYYTPCVFVPLVGKYGWQE